MTTTVDLINSTVRLEQPIGGGQKVTGTGFLISASADDGAPRLILITANHVLTRMAREEMLVGFRNWNPSYGWRYAPATVRIRNNNGEPLWTKHPTQDVSALELPLGVSTSAVPIAELPGARALEKLGVQPGDDMMVLGYPQGISANEAGFPILRSGRVASYPLSPADRYPSYLVDFDVFAGNSGGPVYLRLRTTGQPETVVLTGLLTQQIKYKEQRLAIGNVTQADFVSETISLMTDAAAVDVTVSADVASRIGERAPATSPTAISPDDSSRELASATWRALVRDLRIWAQRNWIVLRDWWHAVWTPDAQRF